VVRKEQVRRKNGPEGIKSVYEAKFGGAFNLLQWRMRKKEGDQDAGMSIVGCQVPKSRDRCISVAKGEKRGRKTNHLLEKHLRR